MRAIEKSLEISGRYNPAQQSTVDAIAIINKTVEVLAKHLSDQPDLLKAIAKDLSHVQQDVRQIESKNNQSIFGLG
jgi:prefoldin subunit 5